MSVLKSERYREIRINMLELSLVRPIISIKGHQKYLIFK